VLLALGIVAAERMVSLVTAVLASDFRLPKAEPQIYVQLTSFKMVAVYGITWAFAIAYEEVLFRAYLQSKLESLLGETILPILISAAIFAAAHGYPPRGALHVFTFGVLFGVIYRLTSRLPRLVLAHWMWDLLRSIS
jgi:membrane protease YdiL (CAAX protease family)